MDDTTHQSGAAPPRRTSLLASARAAFSSWWSIFGIVAASITAFNLLRKAYDIGLSRILADLAEIYEGWVHFPINWIIDWLKWPRIEPWVIDAGVLWLLAGGVVLRSAWTMRSAIIKSDTVVSYNLDLWNNLLEERLLLVPFVLFCVLAWPLAVLMMLREPHIHKTERNSLIPFDVRWDLDHGPNRWIYLYDMRIVILTQLLAGMACVGIWIFVNVVMKLYE